MKSISILFICCLIFSFELLSKTHPLLTVFNDDKKEKHLYDILTVETSDDEKEQVVSFHQDTFTISNNTFVKRVSFSKTELAEGYALREEKGFKVLAIKSTLFSDELGGNITLRFLKNGISGKYSTHNLDLVRNGDFWFVVDASGNFVNKADITVNRKSIIGKVGIKKIEYSTL